MTSIAVIMFSPYKSSVENLIEKINRQYCFKNKYDFYYFQKIPVLMENRNNNWCSYYYILDVLQKQNKKYNYVFYIDSRCFLCNHSKLIESWLVNDKNIYIGLDPTVKYIKRQSNPKSVKTNVIIFKNSEWTIDFLNFIINEQTYSPFWKIKNGYETAFRKILAYNYCNIIQNISFIKDFNFNNYSDNIIYYIHNGGWVLSLTDNKDETSNETIANKFIKINK